MTRLLIAEAGHSGHLYVYVSLLARAALARGAIVELLVTREGRESGEFSMHLGDLVSSITVVIEPERFTLRDIAKVSSAWQADLVLIPHADPYLAHAAALRTWPGSGHVRVLVMRDPHWERATSVRRRVRLLSKRLAICLSDMHPWCQVIMLRQPGYVAVGREIVASDPVIIRSDRKSIAAKALSLRRELDMQEGVFWYGMVGSISPRKNLELVLDGLTELLHRTNREFGFVLLGPQHPTMTLTPKEIDDLVHVCPYSTRIRNELMSNEEINVAIASLDCLVMAYSTDSPNSTLAKAAALGVHVAAAGSSSIARFVADLDRGPTASLCAHDLSRILELRLQQERPAVRDDLSSEQFCDVLLDPAHGDD